MPTIALLLEPTNETDLQLLLSLAQRLGVKATPTPITSTTSIPPAERARLFEEFAGSWQSEEDGTELARQLQEDRHFRDREVNL
ncbi:hypothetical protein SAMN00120144_1446 [Hymenobacter roseosalivarius DSM 11622]|uniref:Uncharacterized protein n=1 Tax=Hymenobacter roseosalivarius DSM 11622 TaxID=645990 RepID=A0A1W1V3P7_9BACT|nr:hypothetical protein [Hymenobacter roseosalivarius]SMB87906.1 hypothetical protein SAMN00120144_1446 [Hymenobacter roseosalivarius DSM 11622]